MSYPLVTTAAEMIAIRAVWSSQGCQQGLPLLAAGYREVLDLSRKYKPIN